jgi:cobalamin biosynthesis protein CobD/CbiB
MTAAVSGMFCSTVPVLPAGFYGSTILTLLLLLCVAGIALRLLSRRAEGVRKELADEKQARSELASFLSRSSSGIRGDEGFEGVMHTTAVNVAEKIDACISFKVVD